MEKLIVFLSLVTLTLGSIIYKTPICMKLEEPLTKTATGYKRIIIHGQILEEATKVGLKINLMDGGEGGCRDPTTANIPLHIFPRFTKPPHVARNTWVVKDTNVCISKCNQGWGPEETSGGSPFKIREWFEIIILCETSSFKIYINGDFFATYNYRIPLERVTYLQIMGPGEFRKIGVLSAGWKAEL